MIKFPYQSPKNILKSIIAQGYPYICCLESRGVQGRYSFIGYDPFYVFKSSDKDALLGLKDKFYKYFDGSCQKAFVPFSSGIMGFLSYDYGLSQEPIQLQVRHSFDIPQCCFGFYDAVFVFDHYEQCMFLCSRSCERLKQMQDILDKVDIIENRDNIVCTEAIEWQSNMSKQEYCDKVQKALEYIGKGDIYQVNLSQCFSFDLKDDIAAEDIYFILSQNSNVDFGGYFDAQDLQIISNSPEEFLSLKGNEIITRPMKGTIARGRNVLEDESLKLKLLKSKKDEAELLMITDLLRNDLGRVCEYGSIKVEALRVLEKYKDVYQTTSTIKGVVDKNKDAFDILNATFPGGSITGCPKIRAMEIIEELEPNRRGLYTGVLGYIDASGDMDFNILIRTLFAQAGKGYCHVGSGIVADSIPDKEYEECLLKLKTIKTSLMQCNKLMERS